VVPNAAVQRGPNGLFAWVVRPDNTAQPVPIQTGPMVGDLTVVEAGLNDGDSVVTGGHYKLQPNATVSFTQPAAIASKGAT